MARSKSSNQWLQEHFEDEFVRRAQKEGYRSRAVFKLEEIQLKDKLFRHGMCVLDLGAAPGGWSQYVAGLLNGSGRVIASDILPIDSMAGVEFVHGDFTENSVFDTLMETLNNQPVDVVISDMAPNITGVDAIDQPKSLHLCELALDMARQVLGVDGAFVVKVFQGEGFDAYLKDARRSFRRVKIRKPKASRQRSREVYLVGSGFMVNS